jgi:flagellar L-ring protein precursor FlgH
MNKPSSFLSNATLLAGALALASLPSEAQSLWKKDGARSMYADKRAGGVGDIVTIVVQENQAATKKNATKTARSSSTDASISSFLYGPGASGLLTKGGQYPAMKLGAKNAFDGGGQIDNAETISARIAVKVIDVLPNRQLLIEGRRQTSFSGEQQEAILRGSIRSEDITSGNTVFSYNVADATIQYVSKGAVSDSQKKGWFTKTWDKVSPF